MSGARRILIDCDPGQDDAVALLTALASRGDLDVVAITTVAGNVPLDLTTKNALRMVELADRRDVPVHAGCSRPMLKELYTAEYVHGPTGLDGAGLPEPTIVAAAAHGVDAIIETIRAFPDEAVTLCTLGPLTNVGMAIVKDPGIVPKVRELVMMGGGFTAGGNTTPAAEFNIFVDPHAAHVVFTSGMPITMMPLDVTHKALTTPPRIEAFRGLGTRAGDAVAGMLEFYDRHDIEKYGLDGGPLHDPCVVAYLLEPDLFEGRRCHVEIGVDAGPGCGATFVDWWGVTGRAANATVVHSVDDDGFFRLLVERIGRL